MSTWTLDALVVRVRDEDGVELDMTKDMWQLGYGTDAPTLCLDTLAIAEALELEREGVRGEQ